MKDITKEQAIQIMNASARKHLGGLLDLTVSDPLTLEEREMLLEHATELNGDAERAMNLTYSWYPHGSDAQRRCIHRAEKRALVAQALIERAMAGMPT